MQQADASDFPFWRPTPIECALVHGQLEGVDAELHHAEGDRAPDEYVAAAISVSGNGALGANEGVYELQWSQEWCMERL